MRFKKVYGFDLMKVGKTQNSLELDEDIIEQAVVDHAFDNAPIVFNENESFKDYRDDEVVDNFFREKVIGVVLPNTVEFHGSYVTADVMLLEEFADRTHFDNWQIVLNEEKTTFRYDSCELFSKEEIEQ